MNNAVNWFEIPTADFERATKFYEAMLDTKLISFPGDEPYGMFPSEGADAVGGALVHRAHQKPANSGTLVYLNVTGKLDAALERAVKLGSTMLVPKTQVPGGSGYFACVTDSEGNHIGLHSK